MTNSNGEVTGVVAIDKENKTLNFEAKAVIIVTGGFDRNPDLMKKYGRDGEGQMPFVGMGNTGDGLLMAEKLNAEIVTHGGVIGFQGVPVNPPIQLKYVLLCGVRTFM